MEKLKYRIKLKLTEKGSIELINLKEKFEWLTDWSVIRFPKMRYSCFLFGAPGGEVPVDAWPWLLVFVLVVVCEELVVEGAGVMVVVGILVPFVVLSWCPPPGTSLRLTETFAKPPPPRGTQPPELSSLVITCALTLTK